jgi:transposase
MAETRPKFDQDFREGAVRLVREMGRPIAQIARDLGINEGTLGNRANTDRRRRGEGTGALGEDERAELARLRRENTELAMERAQALGQGRDGPVAVAALIAAQSDEHQIPHALSCRALGVSQAWISRHDRVQVVSFRRTPIRTMFACRCVEFPASRPDGMPGDTAGYARCPGGVLREAGYSSRRG